MFSKLALFAVAIFAAFVVALPSPGGSGSGITNSCNSGQIYCCDSIQPATAKGAQQKTIDGVVIPSAVSYGLTCSPINFLAAQEQSCLTQTSCCTGNSFKGGAVVLGCSPVSTST